MRNALFATLPLVLLGCGSSSPPPTQPAALPAPAVASVPAPPPHPEMTTPRTRQMSEDTPVTTPSGATFTAPKGWWVFEGEDRIVLEDPDHGLKATLIETPEPDALKAIDAAWQRVEPGFNLKLAQDPETPPPVRGWEAITNTGYETKDADQRDAFAIGRRYSGRTYVAVVDGARAAMARRAAQLNTALWTFKPEGMHEESFRGKAGRPIDPARAKELDAFLEDARVKYDVPGAAVAVVVDNKVVYEKGFGTRTLGKNEPVNADTLFMIGSITKSMTTMMEAALVDQGKVSWDAPMTKLLPSFALGDADLTSKVELWHTACACTGMPRRDLEMTFHFSKRKAEDTVALLKTMKPTTGFGETFQYSNLMVAAGGFAAGQAFEPKRDLGEAYGDAMKKTVFEPFGMKSTTLDFDAAIRKNHATPHAETVDGATHPLPIDVERVVVPVAPAGGVWSNLHDMERYVMTEMADGVTPEGKRVLSEANLHERRKPRVRSGELASYGLLEMLAHDGGTMGFSTAMFMLPEPKVAIISLTNVAGGDTFNNLAVRKVVEEVFEGARDLAAPRLAYYLKEKKSVIAREVAKLTMEPDPAWVKRLAGTYTNADLGKVTIAQTPKGGVFDAGDWKSPIAQKKDPDGTVKVALIGPENTGFELVVGGDDAHPTLTVEDDQIKYVFEKAK
jgi:CubicO group peptidase (beta-lactamase class C family)